MPKLQLPTFCLPFVSRAFRGGRRRRFSFFAALLAFFSLFVGFWLALGDGPFEQELRVSLDLEQSEWEREQFEFILIAHGPDEVAMFSDGFALESTKSDARALLQAAVDKPTLEPRFLELQDRARVVLERHGEPARTDYAPYFEWYDGWEVERIEAIIANDLTPRVVEYHSPLGVTDGFALVGVMSGGALILLLFAFGPLTVGVQQAQEVHENTLQPLTGTALTARELVLGLASGPLSVIALLALPQAALYLLSGVATGSLLPTAGLLVVSVVGCVALTLVAQLIGHVMGRRRTPGVVGGFLLLALGTLLATGMGFGLNLDEDIVTALTLLPQGSAFYLLHEAFSPEPLLAAHDAATAMASITVGTLGLVVVSVLLLLIVERRIAGREGPALTRGEALVGFITAVVMVLMTVPYFGDPWRNDNDEVYYMITLGMLMPVIGLLVMSRVPLGEVPPNMRRVPLIKILGELACGLGIHLLAMLLLSRDPVGLGVFHPVAITYILWCAGVLALMAIRTVAFPVSILGGVWLAFCLLSGMVAFGHAAVWASEPTHLELHHVFALSELSPLLGFVQAGLTVWIPLSLLRALRKNLAGL